MTVSFFLFDKIAVYLVLYEHKMYCKKKIMIMRARILAYIFYKVRKNVILGPISVLKKFKHLNWSGNDQTNLNKLKKLTFLSLF